MVFKMKNLVDNLDLLKNLLDTESLLRIAAQDELIQGIQNGPMNAAHQQSIQNILNAAKNLINS
jgi:hypothetical protein